MDSSLGLNLSHALDMSFVYNIYDNNSIKKGYLVGSCHIVPPRIIEVVKEFSKKIFHEVNAICFEVNIEKESHKELKKVLDSNVKKKLLEAFKDLDQLKKEKLYGFFKETLKKFIREMAEKNSLTSFTLDPLIESIDSVIKSQQNSISQYEKNILETNFNLQVVDARILQVEGLKSSHKLSDEEYTSIIPLLNSIKTDLQNALTTYQSQRNNLSSELDLLLSDQKQRIASKNQSIETVVGQALTVLMEEVAQKSTNIEESLFYMIDHLFSANIQIMHSTSMEKSICNSFKVKNVPVLELEQGNAHFDWLEEFSIKSLDIKKIINLDSEEAVFGYLNESHQGLLQLQQMWERNDEEKLAQVAGTVSLNDRNKIQAEKIHEYLTTQEGMLLAVVGCLHLPGENGVKALLAKKGWTIRAYKP